VQRAANDAAARVLASERFEALWVEVNRLAHRQLVRVLTGEGRVLLTRDGAVVLDLSPVLEAVKAELDARGISIFDRVPADAVSTSFVLMESEELGRAQRGVRLLEAVSIALPLAVLACLAAAIALSSRRRRTVLQAGLGIAAGMVVLGAALTLARPLYVDAVAGPGLPEDAAVAFYEIVVHWLRIGIRAIGGLALLVAAAAFLTGPSRAALGVRSRFTALVRWLAGGTGVRSSGTGRWVGENKRGLRIASILVPVLVFGAWSTPTPAVLVTLVGLALLALLVVEIVGAPPPPAARA
jgi:hypothetical protein